jgi:hypothetical protein
VGFSLARPVKGLNMATIKELTDKHGFPVKITRDHPSVHNWFEIIADSRNGENYPCFMSHGVATAIGGDFTDWELWVEPKPKIKKKLYAYLLPSIGLRSYHLSFEESDKLSINGRRMPDFDCEIDVEW